MVPVRPGTGRMSVDPQINRRRALAATIKATEDGLGTAYQTLRASAAALLASGAASLAEVSGGWISVSCWTCSPWPGMLNL